MPQEQRNLIVVFRVIFQVAVVAVFTATLAPGGDRVRKRRRAVEGGSNLTIPMLIMPSSLCAAHRVGLAVPLGAGNLAKCYENTMREGEGRYPNIGSALQLGSWHTLLTCTGN